jgi:hypothetical protein
MSDLKKMSMSELIARFNAVAATKNVTEVTEFKNLAAARAAVSALEQGPTVTTDTFVKDDADTTVPATDGAKYNSSGKRGPNQGVGEFAKGLIVEGKTNPEVLEAVKSKFPGAKTTMGCIAYYRAAVKNPNMGKKIGKSAEQLRADAAALLAKADAADALAAAKAAAEAKATAEPETATV